MNRFTERRKFSLEQRLADAYEFIEDPGNWSALDGRRALLMQILRPNGADTEATNEKPVSHIRFYKGIPIAVVTSDGKVRTVRERPEDREFFDSEGFVGVKPPYDPEVPATNDPMPSDIQQAVAVLTKCIGNETAAWNTWNNINTDAGFVTAFMRLHASEVPADEGTLRERLAKAARVVGDGNGSWSISHEHSLALVDALMPLLATELQKARAEVEDWFWRNSESTVQDHIRFNSEGTK